MYDRINVIQSHRRLAIASTAHRALKYLRKTGMPTVNAIFGAGARGGGEGRNGISGIDMVFY